MKSDKARQRDRKADKAAWLKKHPHITAASLENMISLGFDLHHVDGDYTNHHPDNLVLIHSQDHIRMHGLFKIRTKPFDLRELQSRAGKIGGKVMQAKYTPEERSAKAKARWANLTPEQRQAMAEKCAARQRATWSNRTPEERSDFIEKCRAGRLKKYSPEERIEFARTAGLVGGKKTWSNRVPEERLAHMEKMRLAAHEVRG